MLDELPWGPPGDAQRAQPTHSLAGQIVDARRCTVQLENGSLYLDALATPATALLGHDHPPCDPASRVSLMINLSRFHPDYRCIALLANRELATKVAVHCASRFGQPRAINASTSKSSASDGIPIAIENESIGRSGSWLASSAWLRKPEFIVLGESLAAGADFGAILVASRLADKDLLDHGHGLAIPPDATIGRVAAVIATVEDEQLIEKGRYLAEYLQERLKAVSRSCNQIASLEISDLTARIGFVPSLPASRIKKNLCERGVLVGVDGNGSLVIKPSLATRPAEIDVITGSLRAALHGTPTSRMSACCAACQMIED